MTRLTRRSISALAVLVALLAVIASAQGAAKKPAGKQTNGTVYAATTHTVAGVQFIAGNSTDKLLGAGATTYTVKLKANPSGTIHLTVKPVTSWYSNGSLTGTADATLVIGAAGAVTVSGTLNETTGTGALKGHSFKGTFSGTGSLTTSQYKFTYTGTYK